MVSLLMRRFSVDVPREKAWEHLANVEQWPTWARHIRRIELQPAGPLRDNSRGVIRLTNGIRSTFRMTEFQPGRNWKWSGSFLWITIHYDHRFRRIDESRTEIEFHVEGEGVGVAIFGRMFAAVYALNLDRAIPKLISEIEGSAT